MLFKSFWPPSLSNEGCAVFIWWFFFFDRYWVKMAEGSRDQGGVGTTDPEEDSPNMIVYRKARLILCVCYSIWSTVYDGRNIRWESMTRRQALDSSLVCISVYLPHIGFTVRLRMSGSFSLDHLEISSTQLLARVPLPIAVSVRQTSALQYWNKLSISSARVRQREVLTVLRVITSSLWHLILMAAVWLERVSGIGG